MTSIWLMVFEVWRCEPASWGLAFSSQLLTPSSPYHRIINFARRERGFSPDSGDPFLIPPSKGKTAILRNRLSSQWIHPPF